MAADFSPNIGKGSISKNDRQENDKQPGYKGSLTLDEAIPAGTKLWISGWKNTGDNGDYISIRVCKAQPRGPKKPTFGTPPRDEIPF